MGITCNFFISEQQSCEMQGMRAQAQEKITMTVFFSVTYVFRFKVHPQSVKINPLKKAY